MCKIFLISLFLLGSALPCAAVPVAACNGTLDADHIRSGGGNYWNVDCDAAGQLVLDGKTYQVFEYSTAGYGQAALGVMEPGFSAEPVNYDHVLDVSVEGAESTAHAGSLADSSYFKITVAKGGGSAGSSKNTILSMQVAGKCRSQYNEKGEQTGTDLESCEGPNWSLHIFPKNREN